MTIYAERIQDFKRIPTNKTFQRAAARQWLSNWTDNHNFNLVIVPDANPTKGPGIWPYLLRFIADENGEDTAKFFERATLSIYEPQSATEEWAVYINLTLNTEDADARFEEENMAYIEDYFIPEVKKVADGLSKILKTEVLFQQWLG